MKCIIIDDEKTARLSLKKLCDKVESLEAVGEFTNPIEAMKFLEQEEVDLLFLDIHMPEISGLDFLKSMRTIPEVIITTSDKNFAVEAFEYDVTDYIIKPVSVVRFLKAVDKVQAKRSAKTEADAASQESSIFINVSSRLIKLNLDDILFLEARGDYVQVKTSSKKHLVHTTLKRFMEKLPENKFIKVHRSYIVNLNAIVDIEDNSILIAEDIIPISRANKEDLLQKLNMI